MDDFAWDDLLDYIQDGKVVPVLGSELTQAEYAGRQVTLQRLLAERLAEKEKLEIAWRPHSELNDTVGAYLEKPRTRPADLYPRIARALRELAPPFPIPGALTKLAAISTLDFFVSLTFDSLMARALDQVRYGGSAVTKEIAFSLNQSTAAQEATRARPGGAPIVFNLFGRASTAADYAIHDEDALEFIHRLVSGDVPPPDWLLSEFRSRHLLILGVHLPDWLSRFVLRAATRDRLQLAQRNYFIAHDNASDGAALAEFLLRFGRETRINLYPGSAAAFVDELHQRPGVVRADPADAGGRVAPATGGASGVCRGREPLGVPAPPVLVWSVQAKAGTDLGIDMSQTRLLDNGRLLVMRRTGDSNRLEVHRLDSERRAPFTEYENAVVSSPGGTHVVWRYDGKMAGLNRLAVGRLGSKEPLVQFPHDGDPPASFSPDDRWMAIFPDRKNVEFFDLAAGRRFARFEGLETEAWFDGRDVVFPGGNRVASMRLSNGAIVLVPLDPAVVGRFARSVVGDRELTRDERCRYLPERSGCTATVRPGGAPVSDKKTRGNAP